MFWQKITSPILIIASLSFAYFLSYIEGGGRVCAFTFIIGLSFGFVMKKSRFCFYCHIRDYVENKNPGGVLSLILALAVGLVGYTVVLASWLPTPTPYNIPPDIHAGPVSEVLFFSGVIFGAGMYLSKSCVSAHWYHLSEGAVTSLFALLGVAAGFFLGFHAWNTLYSIRIAESPIIWLPGHLGYGGALLLQLGVLGAIAAAVWKFSNKQQKGEADIPKLTTFKDVYNRFFTREWNYYTGAALIGILGFLIVIWTKPLGVTATIAAWVRAFSGGYSLIPSRLNGLDGFAGCGSLPANFWLNTDALLLLGLILGSFAASFAVGGFKIKKPKLKWLPWNFAGGALLGFGAMTALGCTVGTLLSGIHAGALSGWVFALGMVAAIWVCLKMKKRFS
jgi:uncharacterized membrane protein YedE/YeeE